MHKRMRDNKGNSGDNGGTLNPLAIAAVFCAVVMIRTALSFLPSYEIDMGGYKDWSLFMVKNPLNSLYNERHVVYAPAYLYLLWITGNLASFLSAGPAFHEFLVKMWAAASDVAGGYLIYKIAACYKKEKTGLILGTIYSLNPGVFFNSSIWGQFDSIPATLLLAVMHFFNTGKKIAAVAVFSLAVLTKPQSGLLAPLVLVLFFRDFSFKRAAHRLKLYYSAVAGICIYIFTVVPFYTPTPFYKSLNLSSAVSRLLGTVIDVFYWIIHLYRKSLDDYPFATANAFNFWTLAGGQPVHDASPFMGMTYAKWGFVLLGAIILLSFMLAVRKASNPLTIYFSAYLLFSGSFVFATRMHERYLLPAIIFITISILWDKKLWVLMSAISICVLANHWYLYHLARKGTYWLDNYDTVAVVFASVTLAAMIYSIYYAIKLTRENTMPKTIIYFRGKDAAKI